MAGGGDQLVKWAWRPENNYRWPARMRDGYGRKTQFLECAQRALYCTHSPSCSTPQHSRTKDCKVKVNNSFGSNLGNDVLNDPFVKKDHNISVFSSHAENSLVGIGSVLEKIVARATGKGPSLSTYSAAAGGNSSSVWQTLLHNQGSFEPKSQTPLSEWLTYVELLAPTGRDKVSKFAVKIAQTLNSKQDAQLEKFKMKLTVPDAVHVLTTLKTPLSAYVFYEWLRKQSYYIPHKSIYGAVFERLTTCMHLSVDTWDDELHVVMEDMLRKKMALDNGQFQRLLAWGCESGSKQPYSSRRMQWYVDWFMKMRKIGFSPHFSTYEKLMKMCNKLGMYESTLSLFKEIPMNTYLWPFKLALCACRGLNNLEMAEQLLNEMKVRDIKPDAKCFTNLLGLYADHGHADKAEELFEEMKQAGVMIDLPVYTSVIHAYGRVGRVEQAQFIFRSIRGKLDPGIYRAMVACYRDAGHLNELLALINEAKGNGIQVGPTCYESAFQACVDKGHWKFAMDIIKDMQACGMLPSPKLYCMLLHVYTKVNDYDACESLFFDMIKMDLQSSEAFEIIIKMYTSLERFSCAMGAFKLMNERQHCRPTAEIYEQIIPLIMKTSLSDAMKKFNDMRSANYIPSLSVYALLIWEHVKAGDMLQSRKLYNDMLMAGLQPDEHILSCMQHSGEETLENADRCADPLKLTCNR